MISRGKQMMMLAQKRSQENVQNYSKVQNVNQSVTNSYDEKMQDCLKPNIASSANANIPTCSKSLPVMVQCENKTSFSCVTGVCESDIHPEMIKHVVLPNDNQETSFSEFDDSDADPNYRPDSTDIDLDLEDAARQIEANIECVAIQNEDTIQNQPGSSKSSIRKHIKIARNSGKPYLNSSNNTVKARECKQLTTCRFKCLNKISFAQQNAIFNKYWSLGDYNRRICYLSGLIQINPIKRTTVFKTPTSKNRQYSYVYHVENNGLHTRLCQKCFRHTLGETDNFIKSVAMKKLETDDFETYLGDRRGKSVPPKKLNAEKIEEIKKHISSFPAYESHYTRAHTSQMYLEADLTLAKMYQLYSSSNSAPVSLSKYSEIFKGMGIKFRKPKLDTCNKCEILQIQIVGAVDESNKLKVIEDQKIHHEMASQAYNAKKLDKEMAETSLTKKVFTFDLQQCLPTPFLKTSVSFYKRPLWTFNLTVHDCVTNDAFCYMWHEGVGGRGGNDIASCLFQHLQSIPETIKSVTYYSDSCPGQNKNSFLVTMFSILMHNSHLEEIHHKFLIPGHTHMECDSDHAIIEKKKKKTNMKIHHPRDWFNFIRTVGNKRHFEVIEMENKFLNFSALSKSKFTFRKIDMEGNKFLWKDVKWLRFTQQFGHVFYKCSHDEAEPFKQLLISKRGVSNVSISEVPNCYNGPLKINKAKKDDLISMLPLIDTQFHSFYNGLATDECVKNIHPDLPDSEDE